MKSKVFSMEFQVRDYELDMFGIVNNAVYQNYFEHTRHQFTYHIGFDSAAIVKSGKSAVVSEIEIKFKCPLQSRDKIVSTISIRNRGNVRKVFIQKLFLKKNGTLVADAEVTCVFLNDKGQPIPPPQDFQDCTAPYTLES